MQRSSWSAENQYGGKIPGDPVAKGYIITTRSISFLFFNALRRQDVLSTVSSDTHIDGPAECCQNKLSRLHADVALLLARMPEPPYP
jgi:hypothetical protein